MKREVTNRYRQSLNPEIISSSAKGWAIAAAASIGLAIDAAIVRKGKCHVMLTGGNTAGRLYQYWAQSPELLSKPMHFLFGDERCVAPDHADSNYALVMRTLLASGLPARCSILRMNAENPDSDMAAREYEALLPEEIDVLLLGMGADGHVASLFPHSSTLESTQRKVLPVMDTNLPQNRLTVTREVITHARSLFLLATGEEKGQILAKALTMPEDFRSLPVRLTLGGTWLLDEQAANQIR